MENSNHQLHVPSNDHHNNKNAHVNKIHGNFSNKGNIFLLFPLFFDLFSYILYFLTSEAETEAVTEFNLLLFTPAAACCSLLNLVRRTSPSCHLRILSIMREELGIHLVLGEGIRVLIMVGSKPSKKFRSIRYLVCTFLIF